MTELVEAYAQLQKAGANVLGAVSNMCSGTDANYVSRYYESLTRPSSAAAICLTSRLLSATRSARRPVPVLPPLLRRPAVLREVRFRFSRCSHSPCVPAEPCQGEHFPDSTAQFMIGRYGADAAQRQGK